MSSFDQACIRVMVKPISKKRASAKRPSRNELGMEDDYESGYQLKADLLMTFPNHPTRARPFPHRPKRTAAKFPWPSRHRKHLEGLLCSAYHLLHCLNDPKTPTFVRSQATTHFMPLLFAVQVRLPGYQCLDRPIRKSVLAYSFLIVRKSHYG